MNSAIIVAGGEGKRFSKGIPKQFHKIFDNDIIDYTISKFNDHDEIDEIIIVSHMEWISYVNDRHPKCKIVNGGQTRSLSVLEGINNISSDCKKVLIHDAARPAINNKIITDCLNALDDYDCVAPIISLKDSIVKIVNDKSEFIDRNSIIYQLKY